MNVEELCQACGFFIRDVEEKDVLAYHASYYTFRCSNCGHVITIFDGVTTGVKRVLHECKA